MINIHYLCHKSTGLRALCDDQHKQNEEFTSNEDRVTCVDCWHILTATNEEGLPLKWQI